MKLMENWTEMWVNEVKVFFGLMFGFAILMGCLWLGTTDVDTAFKPAATSLAAETNQQSDQSEQAAEETIPVTADPAKQARDKMLVSLGFNTTGGHRVVIHYTNSSPSARSQ
jgi:hypothetical protein